VELFIGFASPTLRVRGESLQLSSGRAFSESSNRRNHGQSAEYQQSDRSKSDERSEISENACGLPCVTIAVGTSSHVAGRTSSGSNRRVRNGLVQRVSTCSAVAHSLTQAVVSVVKSCQMIAGSA
jgi:hypothetical protein